MLNGIVIPCYNEANRLDFTKFKLFLKTNTDFTVCFVNDGSKDETLSQLLKFQKKMGDQVMVHNMPQNGGKAEAVRQGINTLLSNTEADNIGFLDADLATGFNDYLRLVNRLKKDRLQMVVGSRKISQSIDMNRGKFRRIASNTIGRFIQMIIGLEIKDTQCGAKVFSRVIAKNLFKESFHSRWLFDVEIFIKAKKYFGAHNAMSYINEVALSSWTEVEGSKITIKDSLKFPKTLIDIAMIYNVNPRIEEYKRAFKSGASSVSRSLQFLN